MSKGQSRGPASAAPVTGVPDGTDGPGRAPGTDALARVLEHVDAALPGIVADFYARLGRDHQVRAVLARLTPAGLEAVQRLQVRRLRELLAGEDPAVRRERSRRTGRELATSGVDLDLYAGAVIDHGRGVLHALETLRGDGGEPGPGRATARAAVTELFAEELRWALLGFRDVDAATNRVLLRAVQAVTSASTVADLARGLVDAMATLDGMAVALFIRPDAAGAFEHEVGSGPGYDRYLAFPLRTAPPITTAEHDPTGAGPVGRAWRSGAVTVSDSHETDASTAPWREAAAALGWRSGAAVPLVDRRGRPRALVSLQASRPGFFSSTGRHAMLEQVKQVAEQALERLEDRPTLASGVRGHRDRAAHLASLADGQVEMLFQPVVALPSGRLLRLEALARLVDGDRLVSPAEFLPAFGHDELVDLFEVGLHQSLGAVVGWQQQGLRTDVSVNLPVGALDDRRYVRLVRDLLAGYGVEPGRLTLELLETGFVDAEMRRRGRFVDELKALGVRLAQDDLGSGYSSLLRLRHFAFDDVKIDQSLVRGTDLTPGHALHFVQPISDIARSQGLSVVIEGLEDDGLIEAAVQLGVDEGQGYGIARPMPRRDVVAWASGHRLDVDPCRPRTPLGGLAGHMAWERRVQAVGAHVERAGLVEASACTLTSYLVSGGTPEAVTAHEAAHTEQAVAGDPDERRAAWDRLVVLVSG